MGFNRTECRPVGRGVPPRASDAKDCGRGAAPSLSRRFRLQIAERRFPVARGFEQAMDEKVRDGVGADAVKQVDLADAPCTLAIFFLHGGRDRSPRPAPSSITGEKNGRPSFAFENCVENRRGIA